MKYSLAKFLAATTTLLVVILVAVFAVFVQAAFERERDAARILAIVTVKRDMLLCQDAMRVEGSVLDSALEEEAAAPPGTVDQIIRRQARMEEMFARAREHQGDDFTDGYDEILKLNTEYSKLLPTILAAVSKPRAERPQSLVQARITAANQVLNALARKSDSLSHSVFSTDPLITEMLRVADLGWRARADAGADRHAIIGRDHRAEGAGTGKFTEFRGAEGTRRNILDPDRGRFPLTIPPP